MALPTLTFDNSISITAIGAGAALLLQWLFNFWNMRNSVKRHDERHVENVQRFEVIEKQQDELAGQFQAMNLNIADKYVKKEDLREMEGRLVERISSENHVLRNMMQIHFSSVRRADRD